MSSPALKSGRPACLRGFPAPTHQFDGRDNS